MTNQTESTAEVGELLPCPFCGGDASDIEDTHSDIIGERYIGCFGRKCELQPHYDYNENRPRAKDRALAAWNTRTPPRMSLTEGLRGWKKSKGECDVQPRIKR